MEHIASNHRHGDLRRLLLAGVSAGADARRACLDLATCLGPDADVCRPPNAASLPLLSLQTNRHTMPSHFMCKLLKTKARRCRQVSHFFEGLCTSLTPPRNPNPLVVFQRCSIFAPPMSRGKTMRKFRIGAVVCFGFLAFALSFASPVNAAPPAQSALPSCDRQCL